MGRTKSQPVELMEDAPLSDGLNVSLNAMTEHRLEIMQQFGDGLPYERDRIVHETRFYMAQSAEAMLEAGKRLVILKENEPHGEFINILENELGLPYRTSVRITCLAAMDASRPKWKAASLPIQNSASSIAC